MKPSNFVAKHMNTNNRASTHLDKKNTYYRKKIHPTKGYVIDYERPILSTNHLTKLFTEG